MTLKDFFTLTELEDGLTTPTRVNELLTVMQNEKESIVSNIGETTQQWSAVATTIATTENKECLDLFIQLDGLWFIDKWLNDAQKLINDNGDGFLEELIVALLRTLERLQVDHHQSVGSGIGLTVQGLLGHSSLVVREKAKALCDTWTPVQHINAVASDVNSVAISPCRNDKENNVEQSGDQNMASVCSDSGQQETGKDMIPSEEVIMESASTNQDPLDPVENEKSKSESTALMGISGPFEDVKEKPEIDSLTTSSGPVKQETLTSSTEVDNALESATKTEIKDSSDKYEDMVDGEESPDHRNTTMECNVTSGIGDFNGGGSQECSGAENPKTTSNTESDEGGDDAKEDVGIESEDDSGNRSRFPKRLIKGQDSDLISIRPSDMELDYGMVDPLELARQVAIEVEQEVDSQEESCSTSTTEKEHQLTGGSGKEVSSVPAPIPAPGPSVKGSPSPGEQPTNDGETVEIPTTQIYEMAQESAPNAEKGFSGFDLNQDVSSEETDYPVDPFSTPISIVSASRAAAVDGLPVAPLQFEGTLGWKGSAATSAFRRIPEAEKTFSSSSSHNNSNQRLNRLDFDLNVSDSSDDKIEDFLSRDKLPITSYLPFREEQEPSSSMKLDRLQLDLNSLGDSDTGIISLDWKHDSRVASLRQNRPQSPSVSSSSSSMQPSFRNMDLNLNNYSTIPNNASLDNPFLGKLFDNKRDEPAISIFGTQVEVNRKEFIPPLQPNGRMFDPSVDFSLGRPGSGLGLGSSMPYANLPSYGYGHNGFSMGPMYGPTGATIPYMVDLRGAPIVPSIPPSFSQQTQPFIFNNMGAPSSSNGAGPSRNNFDLNSGFMTEMGNRENNGGLRQFFNNGQASSSSVIGGKREEPDSGWELFPINYKHQQPPWQ